MNEVLDNFYNEVSQEEQEAQQAAVNQAGTDQIPPKVAVSGRYIMEADTIAYKDKPSGEMRVFPELTVSKNKSLMLVVNLKVVDGTPKVPMGSSIFTNVVLIPAKGADRTTMENVARLMKPQIFALTGQKDINVDSKWIEEWLIPTYEEKEGKYTLVKDHKMKKRVMVTIEDTVWNNAPSLSVKAIAPSKPGDKSVSNEPVPESTQDTESNVKSPSPEDYQDVKTDVASDEAGGESTPTPDVPTAQEDF